ncbi:MAG: aspartate 1-decarboxylase [Nitrospirae bacterium]|nr:aspartate 1-decarboxylase [Nitrospirota bacterium]MBI3594753.1 aspartate 1-decarboxylase [Nitrospirota bacterium]
MLKTMLRSKIHRATITQAELDYEGSITIDQILIDAAGMLPYEQVMISNLNNGERFETYIIPGKKGSGTVCLNGPTARKGMVGDKIIIFCYELYNEEELKKHKPIVIKVNEKNKRINESVLNMKSRIS